VDRPGGDVGVEQVAHVDEADDVVLGAADDRVAGVGVRQRDLERLEHRGGGVEEVDLGTGDHDLPDLALSRGEDLLDEPALVRPQRLVGGHDLP
jgi:hypothetical protein